MWCKKCKKVRMFLIWYFWEKWNGIENLTFGYQTTSSCHNNIGTCWTSVLDGRINHEAPENKEIVIVVTPADGGGRQETFDA